LKEKLKLKAELRENVKVELQKLRRAEEENDDTAIVEAMSIKPNYVALFRFQVSFSGDMASVKVFDKNVKNLEIKPSSASPGKGILRAVPKNVKSLDKGEINDSGEQSITKGTDLATDKKVDKKTLDRSAMETTAGPRKKKVIRVTKKVKEQLLSMDRKQRKAFLRQLKAQKNPHFDRAMQCKLLWEKIRRKKTSKQERDECVSQLYGLVKGYASKLIYAHDTCRIFECLLALKRPGITSAIFLELSPELVRMTKNKYAHYFVLRLLKYGSKEQRSTIIDAFRGHAVSLMRIVYAAQSDKPRTLDEIVAEEPAKKKLIVRHLEEQIFALVEKTTIRLSLYHRLLKDFATHCDSDQLTNLIDSLKDRIPELVHTSDGSYVAMKCVWNANVKDRKLIVKNFKDLVVKTAMEHYGHRVLLAIFDTVDDTVLVNKYITVELGHEIKKVILDSWGEKVIHYLVHPRDGRGMPREEIELLSEGDLNPFSKKEKKDRYAELYGKICDPLYTYLSANMEYLIFESNRSKFIAACLENTSTYDLFDRQVPVEMRKKCNGALVEIAKQEFIPMDSRRLHLIEHPAGHFVLMAVLRCDKFLPEDQRLSVAIVNNLTKEELGSWIACNKGCHVLLKMLHCGSNVVREKIKRALNMNQLKEYTFQGAVLLVEELEKG
uniref:PUM-HD domain-containing protein n=1 Tax=Angiostrongylus cantonensis TaxID=6313 RepID=A0A0K0CZJ5_ANGCA